MQLFLVVSSLPFVWFTVHCIKICQRIIIHVKVENKLQCACRPIVEAYASLPIQARLSIHVEWWIIGAACKII